MAIAVIKLQNRFLKLIETYFQRHDTLKAVYDQAHVLWKASVITRLGQINTATRQISLLQSSLSV